jgi:hypothetical protein
MQIVTNELRTDGFGAQFQSLLWSLLFAELTNKEFMYTDIQNIDLITTHGNIKDTEHENTLDEVIDYMAIKQNYPQNTSNNAEILSIPNIISFIEKNIDSVIKNEHFLKYQSLFLKNKKSRFDSIHTHVAVHIRRLGNFEHENNRFRPLTHDTPNSYYFNIMNLIRSKHKNKNLRFHIYSQGSLDNFKDLQSNDTIFHLNEKVLDTFTDLLFADILITSVSSFSYMAAILSKNNQEVHYLQFWHPPLSNWIVYQ